MYVLRPQLMGGLVVKISICWWKLWQLTVIACLILATRADQLLLRDQFAHLSSGGGSSPHSQCSTSSESFLLDWLFLSFRVMALLRPLLLLLCFVLHSSKSIKCFTCIGPVRFQFDKLLLFMSQIIFSSSSSTSATPAWAPWVRERRIALLT